MIDLPKTRVALVSCDTYETEILQTRISSLLKLLDGLDKYVRPGMKILLKPNLLSAKPPERAITTHPEIVAAVACEVRRLGATPVIGDSPGGAKRGVRRVWENTGMLAMAAREGIELINFEASGVVRFEINGREYFLSRPAVEADLIISLPKLKTHVLTLMTGGVKNMFGLIPGFRKGEYHKEAPKPNEFAQILVDILSLCPPQITVMDAILAMEGDGPSSGTPRRLNLLLGSVDPVALDTIACELIGLHPEKVPTIKIASEAGLGIGWPEMIDIVGENPERVKCRDFKLPSNRKFELIPSFFSKFLAHYIWIRPAIEDGLCTKCQICANSCPTGALQSDLKEIPAFNYEKCINCWCCHELCPSKAVFVDQSWLARKFIR